MSSSHGDRVEVRAVSFTYRGAQTTQAARGAGISTGDGNATRPALREVSLELDAGELCYLMGRTGAGKSTLCRCLNGIIPALQPGEFTGEVRVGGEVISGRPVYEVSRRVGVLFQDFEAQLLASDVEREVAFGLENACMERELMHRRVAEMLELVGLSELRGRDPATLSGGQKQRLALAAVLAPEPSVVVLDEPTTDLDPRAKHELARVLRDLSARGVTLLIADHETGDALTAASLVVLQTGEVAFDDAPELLLRDPERCRELGVLPLPMPELCARLGIEERPLTVAEAAEVLRTGGRRLDSVECARVVGDDGPAPGEPLIEVEGVSFTYAQTAAPALSDVSLTIREGEFVVLLGENGSGKSTLARHLNGLLAPDRGAVRVAGQDTRATPVREMAARVGYLFQNPDHQIFAPTIAEEVAFGPRNLGADENEVARRVAEALEVVELSGLEEASPFVLTKGERQRVALASVLACRPRVIVFDEPTTGLDGIQARAMMELLARLNAEGHTIVVITHCTWAAVEYAHRALVLDRGRLVADAPVREVFADAKLLGRTGQVVPEVTELAWALGGPALLSVDELARCLRGPGRGGA